MFNRWKEEDLDREVRAVEKANDDKKARIIIGLQPEKNQRQTGSFEILCLVSLDFIFA